MKTELSARDKIYAAKLGFEPSSHEEAEYFDINSQEPHRAYWELVLAEEEQQS